MERQGKPLPLRLRPDQERVALVRQMNQRDAESSEKYLLAEEPFPEVPADWPA